MTFWKDKEGNKLTWKEFFSRWKQGIEGITPLQKLKTQLTATKIQLLGIILGIIATSIGYKYLWWVTIILIGALINTGVQYLGLKEQIKRIKNYEEDCEEINVEDLIGKKKKK